MDNVFRRIRALYPITDTSAQALAGIMRPVGLASHTLIIRGQHPDRLVYFIERGLCRSYVLHDGKEHTTWFSAEGDWAYGSWDLFRGQAGFEYVETLEPTLAYVASIERFNALLAARVDLANWMRVFLQEIFLHLQERHIDRIALTAAERYEKLQRERPDLCQRVNLGYLASFLGITPQSLSRIRAGR